MTLYRVIFTKDGAYLDEVEKPKKLHTVELTSGLTIYYPIKPPAADLAYYDSAGTAAEFAFSELNDRRRAAEKSLIETAQKHAELVRLLTTHADGTTKK